MYMATKIVQITDMHLNKSRETNINGINTYDSAMKILKNIKTAEKHTDCLVLSGDISNDCSIESYSSLLNLLKDFEIPIYLMPGNHDSPSILRDISNEKNIFYKNFEGFGDWGLFMFNTKKEKSPNGLLKQEELIEFDKIIENDDYKYVFIFLHHHPVLIGSASMDSMIIENSDLLIQRIKKTNKVKAVCWGHIHNEFYMDIGPIKLFSTPSTCYQAKERSKKFVIDPNASPGYRKIILNKDGKFDTEVIRVS